MVDQSIRNSIANGGGVILPGVNADGSPNQTRGRTDWYANPFGYSRGNNKMHVYDASFVKLREVSIGYDFSDDIVSSTPFTSASVSLIGRNLWIISKNSPHSEISFVSFSIENSKNFSKSFDFEG